MGKGKGGKGEYGRLVVERVCRMCIVIIRVWRSVWFNTIT